MQFTPKVNNLIGLIKAKIEVQKEKELPSIKRAYSKEIRWYKKIQAQIEKLEKQASNIQKALPKGYYIGNDYDNKQLDLKTAGSCNIKIPSEDMAKLERANSLILLFRRKEAEALLRELIKKYEIF